MRIICAWCQRLLQAGPIEKTSHGCCDACFDQLMIDFARGDQAVGRIVLR